MAVTLSPSAAALNHFSQVILDTIADFSSDG
jgi:hypothetical protein